MSKILTLSLPRSLTIALNRPVSLTPSEPLPDLTPITSKLASLTPQPGLSDCWQTLKTAGNNVIIITNGAKATTEGYVNQAGLEEWVDDVRSCDQVGLAKPFGKVYERALEACEQVEGKSGNGEGNTRWFVAAHMWDLAAARKAG